MTVPSTTYRNDYTGTAGTLVFPYTFRILDSADIVVTAQYTTGDPVTVTSGFTVSGVGSQSGGNITFSSAPFDDATLVSLTFTRNPADTQTFDIRNQTAIPRASLEDALDRRTMVSLKQQEEIDRSLKFPISDADRITAIPSASQRALKNLGFDVNGDLTVTTGFSGGGDVSAAMIPVVTAATLAAARASMGPWGDAVATAEDGVSARTFASRANDFGVNVLDYAAVGDGDTDDTLAISSAISSAISKGAPLYFPPGRFLVTSQIYIAGSLQIIGQGATIVRDSTVGSDSVFFGDQSGASFSMSGITFEVSDDTVSSQTGGFVGVLNAGTVVVSGCRFIASNGSGQPCLFHALSTPSCDNVMIHGNYFYRLYGQCCGAQDGVGDGVKGRNISIVGNVILDSIDTGIGQWTNTSKVTITGNVLRQNYKDIAYSSVGIDCAGVSDSTISGNSIDGYTIGIRVATNLNYTNQNISITANAFANCYTNTAEPAQAIKIFHGDLLNGNSPDASVIVNGNTFTMSGNQEYGVDIISTVTNTSKKLHVKVTDNIFTYVSGTPYPIVFQKSSAYGSISFSSGGNKYVGIASPVVGLLPQTLESVDIDAAVYSQSERTLTGSSQVEVGRIRLSQGFYVCIATFGAMTDNAGVGAVLKLQTYPGAVVVQSGAVISSSNANGSYELMYLMVSTDGQYSLQWFPHVAGNTHVIRDIRLIRIM